VLLLEKDRLPRHKVCGEFVSSESLRLLSNLLEPLEENWFRERPTIASARIFLGRKTISLPVSPAAQSIARFHLDDALLQAARRAGVRAEEGVTVRQVDEVGLGSASLFEVRTADKNLRARAVVNTTGRWSQLTQYAANDRVRWIGLKAHYSESSPPDSVDLYFFTGGYCGVQAVGKASVNAAAMVRADAARSLEEVFAAHPELWRRSRAWEPLFPAFTTSPLYFRTPQTEERGMLLAGDAAGFIDPFAGDGISLALHSGVLAAESLSGFLQGKCSLAESRQRYQAVYVKRFAPAFRNAARLRGLLSAPTWLRSSLLALAGTDFVANRIVRGTRAR
jgi:flavin-dependent dehydrogenase